LRFLIRSASSFYLLGVCLVLISISIGLVAINDSINLFIGVHALPPSNATASLDSDELPENATASLDSDELPENATASLDSDELPENATSIIPGTGLMNAELDEKKT
jgi:hypothetical protein